jgi:Cu/Ag efflux pump CusA
MPPATESQAAGSGTIKMLLPLPWTFEAEKSIREIPGAIGAAASRAQDRPYLEIEPDREALAGFVMTVQDVMNAVEIGLGSKEAGVVIEGRRQVPIQVRL